jgi:hypothetical protein
MRSVGLFLVAIACLAAVPHGVAAAGRATDDPVLSPGDLAPDFSLPGSDGKTYTLSEFRGVRPVVIAWFPKALAKV